MTDKNEANNRMTYYLWAMLSINQMKIVRSLQQKKYRLKHGLFTIEGDTIVNELLASSKINPGNAYLLIASEAWIKKSQNLIGTLHKQVIESDEKERSTLSSLVTVPEIIAVVKMPQYIFNPSSILRDYTLVLDQIRDPGNLGTIIRTAAWFGIEQIICSENSVDQFNSKVTQASMGAVMHIKVFYHSLEALLQTANEECIPVFATTLDGSNMFNTPVPSPGLILFGNEAHGISPGLFKYVTQRIRIPGVAELNVASTATDDSDSTSPPSRGIANSQTGRKLSAVNANELAQGAESLNLASAVASVLTECRRRTLQ